MKRWILIVGSMLATLFNFHTTTWAHYPDNTQIRIALHAKSNYAPSKFFPTLCSWNPSIADGKDCSGYNTHGLIGESPGPHIFVMAGQGGSPGIIGVSFGVDYNGSSGVGIDPQFVQFTLCTDGEMFPNGGPSGEFPAPGGGICVSWSTCQNSLAPTGNSGVHAVIGAFYVYVYSAASLRITPNNNLPDGDRELAITDCAYNTINLLDYYAPSLEALLGGRVDFGGGSGYSPCEFHLGEHEVPPNPTSSSCLATPAKKTTWSVIKDQYRDNDDE